MLNKTSPHNLLGIIHCSVRADSLFIGGEATDKVNAVVISSHKSLSLPFAHRHKRLLG